MGRAGKVVLVLALVALAVAPKEAATPLTLAVPERSNANVSLAGDGSFVVATWSASLPTGSTDIYAAVSRNSGATFSMPTRVNATAGEAQVNGEQPPRAVLMLRAGASPAIVVVWTAKGPNGTRLVFARSDDGGRTFGGTTAVPGGEAAGNRGWENVAAGREGNVHVVWLDHREMAPPATGPSDAQHAGHDATATSKKDGVAMAQLSKLYIATLGDPKSPRPITGGVCYCCKTAIVSGPDNAIYLAWRHVYPGNLRDVAFTLSRDGGRTFTTPIRVSEDKWQLDGCPDDGPAITVDSRNQIHVVWPTLVGDGPDGRPSIGIFYARSSDGRAFAARQRVPTEGLPHHPQIAVARDTLFLAWDELKNGTRQTVVARRPLAGAGSAMLTRSVLSEGAPGMYPTLVPSATGVLAAWTSGSGANSVIRVTALQ